MVIAFISDQYWPTISGVCVSIDAFRKELIKMGHTVHILAPSHPTSDAIDKLSGDKNIHRFKSFQVFFTKENYLVKRSEKKNVFAVLDKVKPDIIHFHTEFTLCKIGMKYAKKKKIHTVITAHTNWEDLIHLYIPFIPTKIARIYARIHLRTFFNKADFLITPTSLMETLLHLYFIRTPMRIIPTGISFPEKRTILKKGSSSYLTSPAFKAFPQLKNKRVLFFAGRLGKEKNIPFLFDVLDNLKNKFPNLVLLIAGDGPERSNLEIMVKNRDLSSCVIFTGFVEKKSINVYYMIADVFVFASKVESQGLVALEAMSCGIPVVAIGKMGTREVMSGDNGGFMVDDDLDAFTEKVSLLLKDKKVHALKSKEAIHHADKWRIENMATKVLSLYKKMTGK
jgi:1,2-diacylglycerol 3-alpha-glucosyltransferase